jgi:hypothetical protein|tara:strand:+ start:1335 stop:1490 length:156 start_codon:yes stop_codon:yes gene_type:complete
MEGYGNPHKGGNPHKNPKGATMRGKSLARKLRRGMGSKGGAGGVGSGGGIG